MKLIKHVECDKKGVLRLGCVMCNDTIGTREHVRNLDGTFQLDDRGEKIPYLLHWSHIRYVEFYLSDGSFTDVMVCKDCVPRITEEHFEHIQQQIQYGWLVEAHTIYNDIKRISAHHRNLTVERQGPVHDINSRITRTWPHTT